MVRHLRIVAWLCLLGAMGVAQTPTRDLRPEGEGRRLALIVGNEAYPKWPLKNPANDARSMHAAVSDAGFQSTLLLNGSLRQVERAVDQFVGSIRPGDVALFYYSGHGIQLAGENYLVPVDFDAKDEADAKYVSYSISRVSERIEGAGARLSVLILDACRTNPFRTSRGGAGGLAAMNTGQGTFIAFATGPGQTADDNPGSHNGLFTGHVVEEMRVPGITIDTLFNHVREKVYGESNGKQVPWSVSSVIGEFRFRSGPGAQTVAVATPPGRAPVASAVRTSTLPAAGTRPDGAVTRPDGGTTRPDVGTPRPDIRDLTAQATAAYSRGHYVHAIQVAEEALRIDPASKEALFALAASEFQAGHYERFDAIVPRALASGVSLPFLLIHHHTLTGGHRASLVISKKTIGFDPQGATDCNQPSFEWPIASVVSAGWINGPGNEQYLSVRVRDAQNKVRILNFADAESTLDKSNGLPVLRPPARARRMLQSIVNAIEAARR
jgi:uncharacterized caspase-like protein